MKNTAFIITPTERGTKFSDDERESLLEVFEANNIQVPEITSRALAVSTKLNQAQLSSFVGSEYDVRLYQGLKINI